MGEMEGGGINGKANVIIGKVRKLTPFRVEQRTTMDRERNGVLKRRIFRINSNVYGLREPRPP